MKSLTCAFLSLVLLSGLAGSVQAQTLRWAARGDAQTMDPHAFAESVTSNLVALVYDTLVERDRDMRLVPALASSWRVVEPTRWRFEMRRGVTFSDGSAFSADDVVFSIQRATQPSSQFSLFAAPLGTPVKIDDYTVELRQVQPNPVLLEQLSSVQMMSRAWVLAHRADRVPDFKAGEEAWTTRHAMGTGRFMLRQREPGVRTTFERNPSWWGRFEGNVQKVVFTPVGSDATRSAALIAGDIDLMQDVPPQDIARIESNPALRLAHGVENRLIFFAMDQWRDQLLYASLEARNPFKDVRVRQALQLAIDAETIKTSIMRGQSLPTGCLATAVIGCKATELEARAGPDLPRARKLMAEAGNADGFELTLDCPNDRYVNDAAICVAMVGLLARINVKLRVDARPKSIYFPKVLSGDTSFYLIGWGGGATDPQIVMDTLLHSPNVALKKGADNISRTGDSQLDAWIDAAASELEVPARESLIRQVQRRVAERAYYLPLHRQTLVWASRAEVRPVVTPNNLVRADWIQME